MSEYNLVVINWAVSSSCHGHSYGPVL